MSENLLSRLELIELWTVMAESFGSTLQLPVDNLSSIVLKFEFENEFGTTEVKLSDLASHANTMGDDPSMFKTSVKTSLKETVDDYFKLSFPPLFPSLLAKILKNAHIITAPTREYWLRTPSINLKQKISNHGIINEIDQLRSFFAQLQESKLFTSTNSFFGRREELEPLLNIHYSFLKLLSQ